MNPMPIGEPPERKSFGPVIGIIIILAVLAVGGWYVYRNSAARTTTYTPPPPAPSAETMELQNISSQSSSDTPEDILRGLEALPPENLDAELENL